MSEQPTAPAQAAAPPPSHRQRPPRRRRAFASTLFGYDIFISFALGFSGRGTQSYASDLARQLRLDPVAMGYVFSAFAWAYVIFQIPGGWLLDRFGSKRIYFWSIALWSAFTLLQGFVGSLPAAQAAAPAAPRARARRKAWRWPRTSCCRPTRHG